MKNIHYLESCECNDCKEVREYACYLHSIIEVDMTENGFSDEEINNKIGESPSLEWLIDAKKKLLEIDDKKSRKIEEEECNFDETNLSDIDLLEEDNCEYSLEELLSDIKKNI